jgi:plastocyanin
MKKGIDRSRAISILFAVSFMILNLLYGCSKSNNASPPGNDEVFIQSFAFSPSTVSVTLNTTVVWTNKDAVAHTVTSDNGLFDSGLLNTDAVYSHQFTTAGTFNYHCTVHPNMLGKVVVQ